MIWNCSGSFASRQCARSRRWAIPWNVPTHIPPTGRRIRLSMRARISAAALFVNVTARMPFGSACPVSRYHAIRCTSTRVLPLPAPASTSACGAATVTAARWASLSESRMGSVGHAERRWRSGARDGSGKVFIRAARRPACTARPKRPAIASLAMNSGMKRDPNPDRNRCDARGARPRWISSSKPRRGERIEAAVAGAAVCRSGCATANSSRSSTNVTRRSR